MRHEKEQKVEESNVGANNDPGDGCALGELQQRKGRKEAEENKRKKKITGKQIKEGNRSTAKIVAATIRNHNLMPINPRIRPCLDENEDKADRHRVEAHAAQFSEDHRMPPQGSVARPHERHL